MTLARRLILLAAPAALFAAPAQAWPFNETVKGSGRIVTETRALSGYQGVTVRGPFKVVLRQSGREGVEVRADDNLQALIETAVVDGNTLQIGMKKGADLAGRNQVLVTVDLVSLRWLTLGGSGDVSGPGLKTTLLDVAIGGSGSLRLPDLQTRALSLSIGGSGHFESSGHTRKLSVVIGGSGDVQADALDADEVSVSIGGSGGAQVHANKTLKVAIGGSGGVTYSGDPAVSTSVAGSGTVKRR